MYSFMRYTVLLGLLGFSASCSTTKKLDKYRLIVFNEMGMPIEGAMVTPRTVETVFEAKETGSDGQVDLRGLYPEVPTAIQVRAIRYKPAQVKWKLPSDTAQTVVLEKQ